MRPAADVFMSERHGLCEPRVLLADIKGEQRTLTLDEAWERIESAQPGVGLSGACQCEACVLYDAVKDLR